MDRRTFLTSTALGTTGLVAASAIPFSISGNETSMGTQINPAFNNTKLSRRFRPENKAGFGGVALGNGFHYNPDIECIQAVEAAWNAGIRYFDTSPWYGLGTSERRLGMFLKDKPREAFTLSTKVGRLLEPHENFVLKRQLWKGKINFGYKYDYTAAGVRRSVEDSLQCLGVSSLDVVFIHDLSPDNGDMKDNFQLYFDQAAKGAMPELTKMRDEGLIKGWGLGVNTTLPILKTIEVADPDIFLSACQYSLIKHDDDLNNVFPKLAARDISVVVGAPLCAGLLAGKDRYLYDGKFPDGVKEKLAALKTVAATHKVDLRTAALQFAAAPDVVSGVIPGAHTAVQAKENAASFSEKIPAAFWAQLKSEKLIEANAPLPKV